MTVLVDFAHHFGFLVTLNQVYEFPIIASVAVLSILTSRCCCGRRRNRDQATQFDPHQAQNYWGVTYTIPLSYEERVERGYEVKPKSGVRRR